jgi:DNA methyltransferase 1-associated protein 1
MATAGDIRDIMDLGQAGPRPAPKKKKRVETQPRLQGVTREVQALMGDSVPPIAIVEHKQYKSKPSISQKLFRPRHWEERQFQHGGRDDALVLRHWKRSIPRAARPHAVSTPTDVEMTDGDKESSGPTEMQFEPEFPMEKWNVKPVQPTYTDEQYDNNLKSEDWTREETDYLMDLCAELDRRWILVGDRYEPQEIRGEAPYPQRTIEAIKSRYYTVAAKMMEIRTPPNNMTAAEFKEWETMRNFDAKNEVARKSNAEKLFERTKEEAEEEKLLLEELHRITKNEEDFIKLRKDLYSRLESAPAIRRTQGGEEQPTAMYQTSQGLSMLLQSLLAKERKLKRPTNPNEANQPTPVDRRAGQPNQYSRRETMDSTAGSPAPSKKGSISQPQVRTLTPAEETKFGVTHPTDRITSGVHFRQEKINRLLMAKSQVQTSKIQAALTELGLGHRVLMPTERVVREFERLITNVHLLLDARKTSEKVANEIKILEEAKRIRLGLPKEGEENAEIGAEKMEVDTDKPPQEATGAEKADEDEDAAGEEDLDESRAETAANESTMQVDDAEGDDDDAEGEDDEQDEQNGEKSVLADGEDEEDQDQSYAAEEEDEDDERLNTLGRDDDDEEEEDADADEDDEGNADSDDEDAAEVADNDSDDGDGADDGDDQATPAVPGTPSEADEDAEGDDDGDAEIPQAEPSRPSSSHSIAKSHKRSASVISDASRAGSNRSGIGRKKRR